MGVDGIYRGMGSTSRHRRYLFCGCLVSGSGCIKIELDTVSKGTAPTCRQAYTHVLGPLGAAVKAITKMRKLMVVLQVTKFHMYAGVPILIQLQHYLSTRTGNLKHAWCKGLSLGLEASSKSLVEEFGYM